MFIYTKHVALNTTTSNNFQYIRDFLHYFEIQGQTLLVMFILNCDLLIALKHTLKLRILINITLYFKWKLDH